MPLPVANPPTLVGAVTPFRNTTIGPRTESFSHTVPAGANALVVNLGYELFGGVAAPITWGGVEVPLLVMWGPSQAQKPAIYLLWNPAPGTASIEITMTSAFARGIDVWAYNIANLGGAKFGDCTFANTAPGFPSGRSPVGDIYTAPTDLVVTWMSTMAGSATFTPLDGQTLLVAQSAGDLFPKLAGAYQPTVIDGLTETDWSFGPGTDQSEFIGLVNAWSGVTGTPEGAPYALGPVSGTFTTSSQPAPESSYDGAGHANGEQWQCLHTVPSTHRTLVVLAGHHFGALSGVTYAGVPMVRYDTPDVPDTRSMWVLEDAPVGTDFVQATTSLTRSYVVFGAYSLASQGILAVNSVAGPGPLIVDSQPDAIVVSLVDDRGTQDMVYTPDAGHTLLFALPMHYNNGVPQVNNSLDNGASDYIIATDVTTTITWTLTPPFFPTVLIAFSFIPGIEPPPPDCPGRRTGQQTGA